MLQSLLTSFLVLSASTTTIPTLKTLPLLPESSPNENVNKVCVKQTGILKYKGERAMTIPFKEPVCGDEEIIKILKSSQLTGIFSLPNEKGCMPLVIVITTQAGGKFFVPAAELCLTQGGLDELKKNFVFLELEVENGEAYKKP
jgi:hypothetical protein